MKICRDFFAKDKERLEALNLLLPLTQARKECGKLKMSQGKFNRENPFTAFHSRRDRKRSTTQNAAERKRHAMMIDDRISKLN
jgi:hypothetical protein